MVSRAERSVFSDWWWTVDRLMLAALAVLMLAGLVFLMAGGPPVAERLGLSTFHFVNRQVMFLIPALLIMLPVSFLSLRHIRRLALLVYVGSMVLIGLAFQFGPEIKGAHRWIMVGPLGIQPSEFVKPAFVVLAAWAFSEGARRKDMPGALLALLILPATIIPLILQPDFGQTMLVTIVWCGLFFVAGLHWFWVMGLGGAGLVGIVAAYEFLPHVRARIERFLDKDSGDTFQVDMAMESFSRGGWLGRGPGEGTVKRILPDAHTDFIFAVTAEEFGIVVCLALLVLFAFIVLRGLMLARRSEDTFCRLAATGLILMFGLQAAINMMVNVHLMPAKGMTLPFISYGGSSLLSLALGMGFLIALTRRRPRAEMMEHFNQDWQR
ncbi:FtsW/RodA/SpoVE family cell cycle protein [Microvirga makkahensis]|uniref:Probable peptidoglycan glycosyltransferase FtsW n=1 Tax=Microvirga makkahensis TaxID=1128670 RepID=A0A7X3MNB8_9HYPH|nr:putative peptidoglycan glycosyltransferase FtsW [Microvirga makkahensis]MXQ10155.1 FtsW/RodA/SpoVE family cell cycle protein [Microvirga makkahensis]